jgi:hypothetical protein
MIGNVVLILSFLIAVIGTVRFKKLTVPFKIFVIWLVIDFVLDASNSYIINVYKNNYRLSHVLCIFEFSFYAIIYYLLLRSKFIKKFILVTIALFFIFFLINALFLQPFGRAFPTNAIMTEEILSVLFAVLLFKQMLQYPLQVNIIKQSVFWFNTGILFFSTTMFLNLSLMNYISEHHIHSAIVLYFWHTIDIIFAILSGIAILTDKKEVIIIDAD